jgi:8-oxo-dGTP pyrophosphatase MutT (NUDIX family)
MSDDIRVALQIARKRRDDGGGVETPRVKAPKFHSGPIHSGVAGRTDHLPMNVESGSYVLPADIVSAGGSGNTLAGFKVLRRTFGGDPYGISAPYDQTKGVYGLPVTYARGGRTRAAGILFLSPDHDVLLMRRKGENHGGEWAFPAGKIEADETPEQAARRETQEEAGYEHDGGLSPFMHSDKDGVNFTTYLAHSERFTPELNDEHDDATWIKPEKAMRDLPLHPGVRAALEKLAKRTAKAGGGESSGVPIVAAGGEWVIPPEHVRRVGDGDIDRGHKVLDRFVLKVRKELIGTLRKLDPPRRD